MIIPLQINSTVVSIDWGMLLPILYPLYPLYPDTQPISPGQVSGINSIFGQRFGIPFLDVDGRMYSRPLSGAKLLLCYSIPTYILLDKNS